MRAIRTLHSAGFRQAEPARNRPGLGRDDHCRFSAHQIGNHVSWLFDLLNSRALGFAQEIVLREIVVPELFTEMWTWILQLEIDSKSKLARSAEIERRSLELPNLDRIDNVRDTLNFAGI